MIDQQGGENGYNSPAASLVNRHIAVITLDKSSTREGWRGGPGPGLDCS